MLKKKEKSDLATVLSWNTPKRERHRVDSTTGRRVRSFIVMLSGLILLVALAGLAREFIGFSGN